MARPKKSINARAVFELAKIGCSLEEMARVLRCDATTIGRRFRDEIERGQTDLKIRLRRKQISTALKGNVAMLIYLGKQLLGQADKGRTELAREVVFPEGVDDKQIDERVRKLLGRAGYVVAAGPEGRDETPDPAAPSAQVSA